MRNYVQPGENMTYTAPGGGVTSGTPVLIGSLLVVPATDADAGDLFAGTVVGVHTLDKTTAEAWTEGQKIYWVTGTGKASTTAGGNTLIGTAAAAADAADTSGDVRLDGVAR